MLNAYNLISFFCPVRIKHYLCGVIKQIERMNISKHIKAHGFTIQNVADALGLSRISVAQSIRANGNPQVGTLRRIAGVIGCDVADFFSDEATHSPKTDGDQQEAPDAPTHHCPHCGKPIRVHID